MSNETLEDMVLRHEGYRNKIYSDSLGFATIGVGHLVLPEDNFKEGVEYPRERLMQVFRTDLANAKFYANLMVKGWDLPEPAFNVIVSMVFQLGSVKIKKFKNFLASVQAHDWVNAKKHGLDSLWARQTPHRAEELMNILADLEGK